MLETVVVPRRFRMESDSHAYIQTDHLPVFMNRELIQHLSPHAEETQGQFAAFRNTAEQDCCEE